MSWESPRRTDVAVSFRFLYLFPKDLKMILTKNWEIFHKSFLWIMFSLSKVSNSSKLAYIKNMLLVSCVRFKKVEFLIVLSHCLVLCLSLPQDLRYISYFSLLSYHIYAIHHRLTALMNEKEGVFGVGVVRGPHYIYFQLIWFSPSQLPNKLAHK